MGKVAKRCRWLRSWLWQWAVLVAPRVAKLHCIDPSAALEVAKSNLSEFQNCEFHEATVDQIPLDDKAMDFGYSLGVLHHCPDTQAGLSACVIKTQSWSAFSSLFIL